MAQTREIEVVVNVEELARVVAALRLCLSQMGLALDTLLLEISEPDEEAD